MYFAGLVAGQLYVFKTYTTLIVTLNSHYLDHLVRQLSSTLHKNRSNRSTFSESSFIMDFLYIRNCTLKFIFRFILSKISLIEYEVRSNLIKFKLSSSTSFN